MSDIRNGSSIGAGLLSLLANFGENCPCRQLYALANHLDGISVETCRKTFSTVRKRLKSTLPNIVDSTVGRQWLAERHASYLDYDVHTALLSLAISQADSGWTAPASEPRSIGFRNKQCCGSKRGHAPQPRKSLISRAFKLSQATARHLADDSAPTPPDALEFRESECHDCPLNVDRECRGCGCLLDPNWMNQGKLRWRSEACPAGRWARHNDTRRPLVNPTRNLIFHVYPLSGAEWNWHWHLGQIAKYAPLFNGKICIGIGTGSNLASPNVVQSRLAGVPVSDWVITPNTKQLAETSTFVDLLRCVKTDDPNSITFRYHTKGVTHRRDGVEQPWARLLWETNMDIPSVEDALASHVVAGSMLSREPLVKRNRGGDFFYAGSAYWFRSDVFQRQWDAYEKNRWFVEYWPGAVASQREAACLCHDFVEGSVLSKEYFEKEVMADWNMWRIARGFPAQ